MDVIIKPLQGTNQLQVQVSFTIPAGGTPEQSFQQAEEELSRRLNDIGLACTKHLLDRLDTDGCKLINSGKIWTSKGARPQVVESPFGPISMVCHVYQTQAGGVTRIPVQERARLIGSATPRFGKMIASKLAEMPSRAVARDLEHNHQRPMSNSFANDLGQVVSAALTLHQADKPWVPLSNPTEVHTISIGIDAASLNTREDQWRMTMAGTIALYDRAGERLETIYLGHGPGTTAPEGKAAFFEHMDRHIQVVQQRYPQARLVGICDGAADFLAYLAKHTENVLLDYHHAAEYLSKAAPAFEQGLPCEQAQSAGDWASQQRHRLRDEPGAALSILNDMRQRLGPKDQKPKGRGRPKKDTAATAAQRPAEQLQAPIGGVTKAVIEDLRTAATYFTNHIGMMDYQGWSSQCLPIGSGVTEAACKVLIKQRFCQSGMRWSLEAADALIQLRAIYLTPSRWETLWHHHNSTPASAL